MLGVSDVVLLGLSFDYINAHPGCHWERARPRRGMGKICPDFVDACVACWWSFFGRPRELPTRPSTPPSLPPVTGVISDRAPLLIAAPRRDGVPQLAAPSRDGVPRPHNPPRYLEELKARNYLERQVRMSHLVELEEVKVRSRLGQQARTVDRIGRLFLQSPPARNKTPTASPNSNGRKRESQASSSVDTRAALVPRRGRGAKYYGIRIGRQVGVVDTWE